MKKTGKQIASELRDHLRVQDSYMTEVKALDDEQQHCKNYDEAAGCRKCGRKQECELQKRVVEKDTGWVEAVIRKDRFLKENLEAICNALVRFG